MMLRSCVLPNAYQVGEDRVHRTHKGSDANDCAPIRSAVVVAAAAASSAATVAEELSIGLKMAFLRRSHGRFSA